MKAFLDTGFFLCLIADTPGSDVAWRLQADWNDTLHIGDIQWFFAENRLLRDESAEARSALRLAKRCFDEAVITVNVFDTAGAIAQARDWQRKNLLPPMLLLSAALAVKSRSTHFLSFDPRGRRLAAGRGLALLPERL